MAGLLSLLVEPPQLPAQGPPGRPPAPVKVATVTLQTIAQSVMLVGTAEPRRRSLVASEISGLVASHPVDEGDEVRRGVLLVKLKTDTLELELKSAEAGSREARALHEQAEKQLARTETLHSEGLATLKQFQNDQADAQARGERLTQLETQLAQVRDQIEKSKVIAPFKGLVVKKFTEVGQWLKQGEPVVEIVDIDHMRIEVGVPEHFVGNLTVGESLRVTIDALPDLAAEGRIHSIVGQADPDARTFPVKIDVDNQSHKIKSGMTARVEFAVSQAVDKKTVPKDALVIRGGSYLVFVVTTGDEGSTVAPVPVTTGIMTGGFVEIQGPVDVGQQVVIRGNERLRPGQSVRITE